MAVGSSMAVRGERFSRIDLLFHDRPAHIRDAIIRGYQQSAANVPEQLKRKKRRLKQRTKIGKLRKKESIRLKELPQDGKTRIEGMLEGALSEKGRAWDPWWFAAGVGEKRPPRKPPMMSEISNLEVTERIRRLGMTAEWFGARNGINYASLRRFDLPISRRIEMAVVFEELMADVAKLLDAHPRSVPSRLLRVALRRALGKVP